MFKFENYIDRDMVKHNKEYLFVFGDNLEKWGTAGQAIIRGLPNTFGIHTKRKPSNYSYSFFSDKDEEILEVKKALKFIWKEHLKGRIIVLPKNKIGSGLAKLESKSPIIWNIIVKFYSLVEEE